MRWASWAISTTRWKPGGYTGRELERFLVRVLFCLFAEDTGIHYTSERDILKVIRALFLDDLRAEFQRVKSNKNQCG